MSSEVENCLISDLRNLVSQVRNNSLTEEDVYSYFSEMMLDAEVDSHVVVNVLEEFGDLGKEMALAIKVNEGW